MELREKISNLVVINIEIKNEDDAYEIFETTNARGVDLSVADLLKNLIFKKIRADEEKDIAKEVWNDITTNIEETGTELKKYIRYFWLSKKSFVTEKRLFKEVKNKTTDWTELLNQLEFTAGWYYKLLKGTEGDYSELRNGDKIFKSVFSIGLMGVSQCYIFLLSILRNYGELNSDPTRIFQFIEKFTFIYSVVCKLPGNAVERIYSRYAIRLEETANDKSSCKEKRSVKIQQLFSDLKKELLKEAPSFEVFKESFNQIAYKNSRQGRIIITYILNEINNYYKGGIAEEKIDFNVVNIEHVLPQSPCPEWKITKNDITEYVDRLGNLTLLHEKLNSKAQSQIIKDKIDKYEKSKLDITKKLVEKLLAGNYVWDKTAIEKRQMEFADIGYNRIWKLQL